MGQGHKSRGPRTDKESDPRWQWLVDYPLGAGPNMPQYRSAPKVLPLSFFHMLLNEEYKMALVAKCCLILAIAACWFS